MFGRPRPTAAPPTPVLPVAEAAPDPVPDGAGAAGPVGAPVAETAGSEPPSSAPDDLWNILSASGVALAVCGPDGTVELRNGALSDLADPGRADATSIFAVLGDQNSFPKAWARLVRHGEPITRLELTPTTSVGALRRINVSAALSAVWSDEPKIVVVVEETSRRITPLVETTRTPRSASDRGDLLAALPGRSGVHDLVVDALRRAASGSTSVSVLLCDVDNLTEINHEHGDAVGDQVLTMLAARISHNLRHEDSLGRIGGGQFIVIAENVDGAAHAETIAHAETVAHRIQVAAGEPMVVGDLEIRTTVTVGYSIGAGFEQANDLLSEADSALVSAKHVGAGTLAASTAITTAYEADPWRDQPIISED